MSPVQVKCPTCGRLIDWTPQASYRPFCSERCRLIDLGAWLSEQRGVAADEGNPIEDDAGGCGPDDGSRGV